MRHLAALIILTGAFCATAPGQSNLAMLPSDSGLVLGVEWRKILDSPVGAALIEQAGKSPLSAAPAFKNFQDILMKSVDSVTIAVPASGLNTTVQQPPALIIVKGRFETAELRGMLVKKGQTIEKYNTVELLVPPDSSTKSKPGLTRVALFDSNTILAGDRAQVRAAIDRMKSGVTPQSRRGILIGAAELAAKNELWAIVNIPASASKEVPPAMAQVIDGVKSAELGMSFQEGMATMVNFRTRDDASAQSLAQAIRGLVAMAALSQDESSQASREMLKKLEITAVDQLVRVELSLNNAEFAKILRERQAPPPVMASTPSRSTPTNPARPNAAPSNKIRISGLDSGPLEIPVTSSK